MDFDQFTIALLLNQPERSQLDAATVNALQDAHMAHLADLHEAGHLLAAGPLADERLRGLSILNVAPERALELKNEDPAVRGGMFSVQAIRWMVPAGAVHFTPARFPRSIEEARS